MELLSNQDKRFPVGISLMVITENGYELQYSLSMTFICIPLHSKKVNNQ
jgi:hypothetical protein